MTGDITGNVQAVSSQAAAALFAMEHRDQLMPGWTFTVLDHSTGEFSAFRMNEEGDVVPCEPSGMGHGEP